MIEVNGQQDIEDLFNRNGEPIVLKFGAPWCQPCKEIDKALEEIETENQNLVVAKVNVDNHPEMAGCFQIMSLPTLIFIKDGLTIGRAIGMAGISKLIERFE